MTALNSKTFIAVKAFELHYQDDFLMLFHIPEDLGIAIQKAVQVQSNVNKYTEGETIIPMLTFPVEWAYLYQIDNKCFSEHFSELQKQKDDTFPVKLMDYTEVSDFDNYIISDAGQSGSLKSRELYRTESKLQIDVSGLCQLIVTSVDNQRRYMSPFMHLTNIGLCKQTSGEPSKLSIWAENIGKSLKSMKQMFKSK